MAESCIFQHHHHRDVGEGRAAHYRAGVPFSIPGSRRSSSVCSDCHGLVSGASKWSHQSQSHRHGKSSIHQLKMMKSESSALIKASQGEITDTKRVVTTEKILMRNGSIARGRPSVSLRSGVFVDRPNEGVMVQRRRSWHLRTPAGDGPRRHLTHAGRCFGVRSQS